MENEGELDFSEFVQAVATYCMFGKEDVLKFCFYIFDRDKNGYIEEDELHALVQMLHQNSLSANLRLSLDKLDTNNDGKVDFKEFKVMNDIYPQVLFPAFRMQANMMMYTLGNDFWLGKRHQLETKRQDLIKKSEKIKAAEEKRLQAIQRREIRRRMGFVRYYLCCLERQKYAMAIQPVSCRDRSATIARLPCMLFAYLFVATNGRAVARWARRTRRACGRRRSPRKEISATPRQRGTCATTRSARSARRRRTWRRRRSPPPSVKQAARSAARPERRGAVGSGPVARCGAQCDARSLVFSFHFAF